jgi:DNA-binding NtrC family response regulator
MERHLIYVIDDEASIREGIVMAFRKLYRVEAFATAEDALETMTIAHPDLVLLDVFLPGMDGMEALRQIRQSHPDTLVVMVTALGETERVVSAMRMGAYDYVVKPIHPDTLEITIRNALKTVALKKEVDRLQETCLEDQFPWFVGESKQIRGVMDFVKKVAMSPDTPVLILGGTGTGKELIARAIHLNSPNFSGPLVAVNCAAIPKELFESELFGYEQGAFSGARAGGKRGLIEEAANGTLFFDEVGDLAMDAQAKLLRFLEDGNFYHVGGTKLKKVQTKIISATNKNLEQMVGQGLFREDLYYRLAVIRVEVPSLNTRPEDILPLARRFLAQFALKFGKHFTSISTQAEKVLLDFSWRGNVRELKNVMERGVLTGNGPQLSVDDLGIAIPMEAKDSSTTHSVLPGMPSSGIDLTAVLEEAERHYMMEALKLAGGNESQAARLLNLNHHTFRYRKKKLRME